VVYEQNFLRIRLNRARDPLSVLRAENEDPKDQQVESALEQGEAAIVFLGRHLT
jgi:hypothetical protein